MRKPVQVCIAFLALAGLHVGIPASMLIERTLVLTRGTEVRLALTPRDPRSLFRGDYSVLSYAIGDLRDVPAPDDERQRCASTPGTNTRTDLEGCNVGRGSEVFVSLEPGDNGVYRATRVSMRPPASGLFIRGKVRYGGFRPGKEATCPSGRCFSGRIDYGIESWFGPQGVPAQIDRVTPEDLLAVVKIDATGRPVLSGLLLKGQPVAGR